MQFFDEHENDSTSSTGMTPEAEAAASQGWELMKVHKCASLILWKAEDGWEGAWEVVATLHESDPRMARIFAQRWTTAQIVPDFNPN